MEMRDYASRVLFAESLEEKLSSLGASSVSDGQPGKSLVGVPTPGRPGVLKLRAKGERLRTELPSRASLVDDGKRGALLHFFANHELLAAELMALALLKFPDAPAEFREGLFHTLREEQRHTRWYVERMRECGVDFGDLPVNRFFWDAVAPMETPLDYVSRLSLTFEQANLDYSRHFAAMLAEAGDVKSARILERIYHDEIRHVGYGLRWFRRWKPAGRSDWQAYAERLDFPLSPSRAKAAGVVFNSQGRLDAGLDEDFVRALRLYERSRGRTPHVFRFQADAEDEIAASRAGIAHTRRAAMEDLARDLEILPAFLARRDDVVLVERAPSPAHKEHLLSAGFELPEFELVSPGNRLPGDSLLHERRLDLPRPWAWSPGLTRLLTSMEGSFSGPGRAMMPPEEQSWRELLSKAHWSGVFDEEPGIGPVVCADMESIGDAVRGGGACVFKVPWGAAGRGQQRIRELSEFDSPALRSWLTRVLHRQGSVVVEKLLPRVFDFSVQYDLTAEGLKMRGLTRVESDSRGVFRACSWRPKFCQELPAGLARLLMEEALPLYQPGKGEVARRLEARLHGAGYLGPVGIDAFVWRGEEGGLRLRRVCEVNVRQTMGRVTIELAGKVADGCRVRFSLEPKTAPGSSSLWVKDDRGRLREGTCVLNDPAAASRWLAVLRVGDAACV